MHLPNFPYAFNQAALKFPEEIKGLISIIIPIYNTSELYLKEALDSVAAQTFENWETILVNDGSTDKTVEKICTEYAEKDSRFRYVCKKKNEGLLLARKTGLENAKGEYIANLDSDDFYNPQFLEKMFAKIKERDYDFVWCDYNADKLNNEFGQSKLENCHKYAYFGVQMWNKLIKRNIYAKAFFPQIHLVSQEDHIQLLYVVYHSKLASYVPNVIFTWRKGHASASNPKNSISKKNRSADLTRGAAIIYTIMEQLFNASEAEAHTAFIEPFKHYFFLSKEDFAHYKIEYVENFVPAFLRGVKKSRDIKFFKKMVLILACKGFALPFRFYHKMGAIHFVYSQHG
jgi:glycosyltransferase involved in cell wall biosynthesis